MKKWERREEKEEKEERAEGRWWWWCGGVVFVLWCVDVCFKLRNKFLSKSTYTAPTFLFFHPCKTWMKKNWHITSLLMTVACTRSSHTQQHTTKHNNTHNNKAQQHTQQHTEHTQTHTHNKAELQNAGLFPNGTVSIF